MLQIKFISAKRRRLHEGEIVLVDVEDRARGIQEVIKFPSVGPHALRVGSHETWKQPLSNGVSNNAEPFFSVKARSGRIWIVWRRRGRMYVLVTATIRESESDTEGPRVMRNT